MGKVYKVWHTLRRAGKNVGHFTSDLIFLDGNPTIVFEWNETSEGDVPAVTAALDPQWLQALAPRWPNADYIYKLEVDDPRSLS